MFRDLSMCLMDLRMASKQAENQGKPPIASPDVVETADFVFSTFRSPEQCGDSGSLLLAKLKSNQSVRYVVKHEYTDCACNEFVYTKLAQAMGYTMPGAILFRLSPKEKRKHFKTEYIIGIRYLDLDIESPSYVQIREKAENWKEYFSFLGMYAIFGESDSFETPLSKDGKIYRLDTTAAFPISTYHLDYAGIDMDIPGVDFHKAIRADLSSRDFRDAQLLSCLDIHLNSCKGKDALGAKYFLEPLARIQEIRGDYIDDFLNTLCYFYPDLVGDFFKRYITELQRQCYEYLKTKR